MDKKTLLIAQGAMIAALYVVLTIFVNAFNLANGAIQVRLSEALCILPIFTPAAVPGLFIGCLLANTLTGCAIYDIIFGSIATLLGALGTYYLRKTKFVFTLPPVAANTIVVPLVLKHVYMLEDAYLFLVVTIFIGEFLSICVLGMILKSAIWKHRNYIFRQEASSVAPKSTI